MPRAEGRRRAKGKRREGQAGRPKDRIENALSHDHGKYYHGKRKFVRREEHHDRHRPPGGLRDQYYHTYDLY
jgi:hypothetical protein